MGFFVAEPMWLAVVYKGLLALDLSSVRVDPP